MHKQNEPPIKSLRDMAESIGQANEDARALSARLQAMNDGEFFAAIAPGGNARDASAQLELMIAGATSALDATRELTRLICDRALALPRTEQ